MIAVQGIMPYLTILLTDLLTVGILLCMKLFGNKMSNLSISGLVSGQYWGSGTEASTLDNSESDNLWMHATTDGYFENFIRLERHGFIM